MQKQRIVVLGGYGNFGKRIVENLAQHRQAIVIIAGRNLIKSQQLQTQLVQQYSLSNLHSALLDSTASDFKEQLAKLQPHILIHTAGPFQGQDYSVAQCCIDVGCHYIDLADDRRYVCDIAKLHAQAENKQLLLVAGASSVPGL